MESIARNQATVAQIQRLEDASINPLTEYASNLRVACTQPRRLAATALAGRVSEEMGVVLGEEVGYQIGGKRMLDENGKRTRLAYMTEGVLLGKQASDKDLSEYACIIIDEAHERTVETDMLMAMLKKILRRRKDLKVVIMSATMDAKLFQDYFNKCPLVHIEGRNFHVDVRYTALRQAISDFRVLTAMTVAHIHENSEPGHILVFVPGQAEIRQVCELVGENTEGLDIFPLYSTLAASEQSLALNSSGPNRKCIVSTNIAETSLTIANVVYVIDTGLSRQMIYNPRLGMHMLQLLPISQASARQRAGRAGRTRDGVCYRLYSLQDFERMIPSTTPAIRSTSVHAAALRLCAIGKTKIVDFDWIDPPHPETIARAAMDLRDWGFLKDDGLPTKSGRLASKCPLDPIWYRAIEEGAKLGCAMDIVDIAVLCSSQKSIFLHLPKYRRVTDTVRGDFGAYPSDHLALANAFDLYMLAREKCQEGSNPKLDLATWCKHRFLDFGALEEVRKTRESLGPFLKDVAKLRPTRASVKDKSSVLKALAIAFCTQTAIYHDKDDGYRTVHENVTARLAPLSCLVDGQHEWVVYTSLDMLGRKVYLQTATAINAEWLVDLPYFQEDRLPLKGNGLLRQENVKKSLDAAKARIAARKAN